MATNVTRGNEVVFSFINPMPEGSITVRFSPEDNRLEIDLPCGNPSTVNRLYIEHDEEGFTVYSHNHNVPGQHDEEREINARFE